MRNNMAFLCKCKEVRMLLALAFLINFTNIVSAECPIVDNEDESVFEYNSMCYHYIVNPDIQITYDNAEPDCKSRGGHLVTIKDNVTQNEMVRQVSNIGDVHTILIGLKKVNGAWKWSTGESLLYNNWKVGDMCDNCDCAKMKLKEGGAWDAVSCQTADWFTAYVCEYAPVDGSSSAYGVHPMKWSVLSALSTLSAAVVIMLCH